MSPDFPPKIPIRRQYHTLPLGGETDEPTSKPGGELSLPGVTNMGAVRLGGELSHIADLINEMSPAYGEVYASAITALTATTTPTAMQFSGRWPGAGSERGVVATGSPLNTLVADKVRGVFRVAFGADIHTSGAALDWSWDLYINGVALGRAGSLRSHGTADYNLNGEHLIPLSEGDQVQLRLSVATGTRGYEIHSAYMTMQRIA